MTITATPIPGASAPSEDRAAAPMPEHWIELVEGYDELAKHRPAWDSLAREPAETNVFYEPWFYLPGLQTFGKNLPLLHVLVYKRSPSPKLPPILIGFFPLLRRRGFLKLPVSVLQLWQHTYNFLNTPLIHRDHAHECLTAFLEWARTDRRSATLLELPLSHAEGPFHQTMIDVLNEQRLVSFVAEQYNRALLIRARDAEAYLAESMSTGNRKELRRQRRRLGETGKLESRTLQLNESAEPWIEGFLQLEASGWKRDEHTAFACDPAHQDYFRAITTAAHERGQLHMLGLFLDGRPIALKCNFLSGPGGFTFKIAYDESLAKFSPGVLLELDNLEDVHRRPEIRWMDSCAMPGHFMIGRLWRERRTLQTLWISTSRWLGNPLLGIAPLLRAASRTLVPAKKAK
jgi:CelD/BcsL family acetyltransferase involved in cellulose biosynthesis